MNLSNCFFFRKINSMRCFLDISKKKFPFIRHIFLIRFNCIRFFIYSIFVFNAYLLNGYLTNNIRFNVLNRLWCPAFGTIDRCDLAIRISFVGMLFGIFMLCAEFSSLLDKKKRFGMIYGLEIRFLGLQLILWIIFTFLVFRWNLEIGAKDYEIFRIYLYTVDAIFLLLLGIWVKFHEEKLKIKEKKK